MFNALDQHVDIATREEIDLHHGVLMMRNIDTLVGVAQLDIQVGNRGAREKASVAVVVREEDLHDLLFNPRKW